MAVNLFHCRYFINDQGVHILCQSHEDYGYDIGFCLAAEVALSTHQHDSRGTEALRVAHPYYSVHEAQNRNVTRRDHLSVVLRSYRNSCAYSSGLSCFSKVQVLGPTQHNAAQKVVVL